jgi:hypothetical protein
MTQARDIHDMVEELTRTHRHREPYTVRENGTTWTQNHQIRVPALLTQLTANDIPSTAAEEGPRPAFASRPAARLDALDIATRIDLQAARWVRDLGEDDHHLDTAATIRQLHGLHASADHDTQRAIERDVRTWWLQARIITGWDSPAWTPDATCPVCTERGTIRIRLADHIGMCTNDACRTTWDTTNIGLLADHIRAETDDDRPAVTGPTPCWCPVPMPAVPDLVHQCRRCGSTRCWHALSARTVADTITSDSVGA